MILFFSGMLSGVILGYAMVFAAVVLTVRRENRSKERQP